MDGLGVPEFMETLMLRKYLSYFFEGCFLLIASFGSPDLGHPSSDPSVNVRAPAHRSRSRWGSHSADPLQRRG